MTPSPERLYNSREARKLLGDMSESKFRQLTKSGELPAKKQGSFVYVPQSAIDAYIAALPAARLLDQEEFPQGAANVRTPDGGCAQRHEEPRSAPEVEPDQLAYKVPHAARVIDLSERQMWELVRKGEIESFKIGTSRRIARQALLDYIQARRQAG